MVPLLLAAILVALAAPLDPGSGRPAAAGDDCGPEDCVGRGDVWAPMWDLRAGWQRWEVRASDRGEIAVGSWFDTTDWRVEVRGPGGTLVGALEPVSGRSTTELRFCAEPGAIYEVLVRKDPAPDRGLHYRMYWRGVDWVRTDAPLESDPEVGFDQRWGSLPARFADTTWFVEVEDGSPELVLSWEVVTGDATGPVTLLPPGGGPPEVLRSSFPSAGNQHWPARYDDCWGLTVNHPVPPPPVRECEYYEVFDPVPDPEPGLWGLEVHAGCDGDPATPEPECDPYASHYILDRKDDGPRWLYLTRDSFQNPDIRAVAAGVASCGRVRLDGSGSSSSEGGLSWRWSLPDGTPLGEGEFLETDLGTACTEVLLEVEDRCGLVDTDRIAFEDRVPPETACPPDEAIAVDSSCRGAQAEEASASDDCALEELAQSPPAPVEVRLAPVECRREVPVTATARDACGNESSCGWTLVFEDRTAPVIRCPVDADATPDLFEVPADASCRGVFDERASARDNCSTPDVRTDPALPLLLGKPDLGRPRPVSYTAADSCGLEAGCGVRAVLVDETPPAIEEVLFDGGCLWPPDHDYVCLEISDWVRWSDNCTDPGEDACGGVRALSCESDQPEDARGDGRTAGDCLLEDGGARICVRSERRGDDRATGFAGRTYTVEIEALDCAGNRARATGRLLVPHDRHRGNGSCTSDILP